MNKPSRLLGNEQASDEQSFTPDIRRAPARGLDRGSGPDLHARIKAEGWKLVATYTDSAQSGASHLRPGIPEAPGGRARRRLRRGAWPRRSTACRATRSTWRRCSSSSLRRREDRDTGRGRDQRAPCRPQRHDERAVPEGPAPKMRRGLEGRVRQGRSGGGLSYGYDVVRELDTAASPSMAAASIDEAEGRSSAGSSRRSRPASRPRAIARGLNAEHVPGPEAAPWSDTTIRGHALRGTGILHNELYIGRLVWNRQRYVKDPSTGKRLARLNPEREWIVKEVPELRIVDDDLWHASRTVWPGIRGSARVLKRPRDEVLAQSPRQASADGAHPLRRLRRAASPRPARIISPAARPPARDLQEPQGHPPRRPGGPDPRRSQGQSDAARSGHGVHRRVPCRGEPATPRRGAHDAASSAASSTRSGGKLDGLIEAIADGFRAPGLQTKLDELEQRKARLAAEIERCARGRRRGCIPI